MLCFPCAPQFQSFRAMGILLTGFQLQLTGAFQLYGYPVGGIQIFTGFELRVVPQCFEAFFQKILVFFMNESINGFIRNKEQNIIDSFLFGINVLAGCDFFDAQFDVFKKTA